MFGAVGQVDSKPNGGVRGIVARDGHVVKSASAPLQRALSTRAGTDCVAHALQSLTEETPSLTVMSIDCIGVFDRS